MFFFFFTLIFIFSSTRSVPIHPYPLQPIISIFILANLPIQQLALKVLIVGGVIFSFPQLGRIKGGFLNDREHECEGKPLSLLNSWL